MKKDTYLLIAIGIFIIFGIGILIGLNINNKINNDNIINSTKDEKSIKEIEIPNTIEEKNNEIIEERIEVHVVEKPIEVRAVEKPVVIKTNNEEDIKEETSNENIYSENDIKVIDALEEAYENIKNSEVTENFKASAKLAFINLVDFIFYDGTIKGVTFNELTDNGKQKVLQIASKIDDKIESKVPNYKEKISDTASKAYISASNLIKKGSSNLNNFLKEKLSDENYNAIINAKEDIAYYTKNAVSYIKDTGSKLFSNIKISLSEWYKKYKNS